tara:strand:+ start:4110 stop:4307 length:198 start_codon:yes stop_codon:yes gene_type:complete
MSYFVVKYCELKACQHWRLGNTCTKDGLPIAENLKYVADLHDSSICQVRKQINEYRLEHLLEEPK